LLGCAEACSVRVETSLQSHCPDAGKAQGHRTAPAGAERCRLAIAQQCRSERIRHHQATFIGDQHLREVAGNREIKTVSKIAVGRPLAISAEIGDRSFDLDNYEIAGLAERKNISATPVREREFDEAGVAELIESAADAPSQELGGYRGLDIVGDSHQELHIIRQTD